MSSFTFLRGFNKPWCQGMWSQVQLSNPHQPTPTCFFFAYFPEVVCGLFLSTTFSFCMKWKHYNFRNTSKSCKGLRCGRTTWQNGNRLWRDIQCTANNRPETWKSRVHSAIRSVLHILFHILLSANCTQSHYSLFCIFSSAGTRLHQNLSHLCFTSINQL